MVRVSGVGPYSHQMRQALGVLFSMEDSHTSSPSGPVSDWY